jgi:aspartyl/asparaginyl beta-hydroxylase (cupin superfamily)
MVRHLLAQASQENLGGNPAQAIVLLRQALQRSPGDPAALNMMGVILMKGGRHGEAAEAFGQAVASDPQAPALWLNLGAALENAGRPKDALGALDKALACDPYMLAALLRKARLLELLGQKEGAVRTYRSLFQAMPASGMPAEYDEAIEHGRALVGEDAQARRDQLDRIPGLASATGTAARAYLDQICGLRKIYPPNPTGPHFPFLPAFEFFERETLPWLDELEQGFEAIRNELVQLWREDAPGFQPYIQYDPTKPLNQWKELNESPRWNAFSLWSDGKKVEANCARCPETVKILSGLPMLDIPGKAPAALFSVLAPRTRIPPHTGTTNTRAIVHLPLVVPEGCAFRVGGETREWVEGKAWAFDDTIEHEAWNNSEKPRAILILDAWNPYLSEADREIVRLSSAQIRL